MEIKEWLSQSPKPEEVLSLNKDGTGKYIPYEIVVGKLYQLCGHEWSDYNLRVLYFNLPNRKTLVSGTIEVEVNYMMDCVKIKRILAGGANFVVNNTRIPHTTASIRSLAVMSTVKPLGKQFGWQLNEGEEASPKEAYAENNEDKKQEIEGYIEAITTSVSLKALDIYKKLVERENIPKLTEAYNLRLKQLRKTIPSPKKIQLP